jgi:hypothetical protein
LATGLVSLPGNPQAYVLKLANSILNLIDANNVLTNNSFLAVGNNAIVGGKLRPPDGFDTLSIFTPEPGDTLSVNAAIANTAAAENVGLNLFGNGRVNLSQPNTYTGGTISSVRLLVVNPNGSLGTGPVEVRPNAIDEAIVRLVDQFALNHFRIVHNTVAPTFVELTGASGLTGDVDIENMSASQVEVVVSAPGASDIGTISGNWSVVGPGNPVTGEQGDADVTFFGLGTHINNGNLNHPKIKVELAAANHVVNGMLPDTTATGNIFGIQTLKGPGLMKSLQDANPAPPGAIDLVLEPGLSIGTLTVQNDMRMRNADFTYVAEIDDAGGSDRIAVGGTLDLSTPVDTLDIQFFTGSTLADATYTLATYGSLVGNFNAVRFAGSPIADPTAPGAFQGTHQLYYGPTALLLTPEIPILVGDYNNDGKVDAADYVVWRKNEGTMNMLPNDPIGGTIGSAQYNQWRAHFGNMAGAGGFAGQTVPEPTMQVLCCAFAAVAIGLNGRRRRRNL